jgi:hypothetical protein
VPTVADELYAAGLEKSVQVCFGDVTVLLRTRGHSCLKGCGLLGIPCSKNSI